MLIALFTILFLGGGSDAYLGYIAESKDNVKMIMADGEERQQALDTLKAMKKRAKERSKLVKRTGKKLNNVFGDVDVSETNIDAIWDEYFSGINDYDQDMLELRFELREHIKREDWERIFSTSQ